MKGIIKGVMICGGLIVAAFAAAKANDIYKEKHEGRGIVEDVSNAIETHPVASTVISISVIALAAMCADSYEKAHRGPEWYALEEKKAEARAQIRQAELEDSRKRDEFERLQAEKQRMDELDFYRQMPAEYWAYRSSIEDRKAREKEANSIVQTTQYVSDNELEAAKYVSDNELEAKKVKNNSKGAKKKEEVA